MFRWDEGNFVFMLRQNEAAAQHSWQEDETLCSSSAEVTAQMFSLMQKVSSEKGSTCQPFDARKSKANIFTTVGCCFSSKAAGNHKKTKKKLLTHLVVLRILNIQIKKRC